MKRPPSVKPGPPGLRDLVQRFACPGRVEGIVIRPERRQPAQSVLEVRAEPGRGLIGDRRSRTERTGEEVRKRELTLIQAEHFPVVARWCGLDQLEPVRLRRNLVIGGLNLLAMRPPFRDLRLEWLIGDRATIEITGLCEPCSFMEKELGPGGYNALRGHGGVTAIIRAAGLIRVGDPVRLKAVHHGAGAPVFVLP